MSSTQVSTGSNPKAFAWIVYRFEAGRQVNMARFATEAQARTWATRLNTNGTANHYYYDARKAVA